MDPRKSETAASAILYSCYHQRSRDGEHFVPEHTVSFQVTGSLLLNDGSREYRSNENSLRLVRRNQLVKFFKIPPENGEYRSISIYLDQKVLKDFSVEYGYSPAKKVHGSPVLELPLSKALQTYFHSLLEYEQSGSLRNSRFVDLKIKEDLLLLLQAEPELQHILFDFAEPHKLDLEAFMNKNYHFNVHLERFAYLTGRSLATFKRDFEKIFGTAPGRWLQEKRLEAAHYRIEEKGEKVSDVYFDLGFENLSHFSYAYKKKYGVAPSRRG